MAIPEKTRTYTVEEFEAFIARPENADRLFELIHGEIVEKVPTQKHGLLTGNLFGFVWSHTRQKGVGFVVMEVRHRVPGDQHNDRIPDISYYADADKPLVERGPVPYLPDLAIEVKSPDDTYNKMREKADYYLANGVRLVWLVYPEKRLVVVRTPDSEDILTENDTLDGGDVLLGFTLSVRDIFMKGNQPI
jgi:Uma2 family endonuclease